MYISTVLTLAVIVAPNIGAATVTPLGSPRIKVFSGTLRLDDSANGESSDSEGDFLVRKTFSRLPPPTKPIPLPPSTRAPFRGAPSIFPPSIEADSSKEFLSDDESYVTPPRSPRGSSFSLSSSSSSSAQLVSLNSDQIDDFLASFQKSISQYKIQLNEFHSKIGEFKSIDLIEPISEFFDKFHPFSIFRIDSKIFSELSQNPQTPQDLFGSVSAQLLGVFPEVRDPTALTDHSEQVMYGELIEICRVFMNWVEAAPPGVYNSKHLFEIFQIFRNFSLNFQFNLNYSQFSPKITKSIESLMMSKIEQLQNLKNKSATTSSVQRSPDRTGLPSAARSPPSGDDKSIMRKRPRISASPPTASTMDYSTTGSLPSPARFHSGRLSDPPSLFGSTRDLQTQSATRRNFAPTRKNRMTEGMPIVYDDWLHPEFYSLNRVYTGIDNFDHEWSFQEAFKLVSSLPFSPDSTTRRPAVPPALSGVGEDQISNLLGKLKEIIREVFREILIQSPKPVGTSRLRRLVRLLIESRLFSRCGLMLNQLAALHDTLPQDSAGWEAGRESAIALLKFVMDNRTILETED
jgi:hypothetical protein